MQTPVRTALVLGLWGAPACAEPGDGERGDTLSPADPTRAEGLSAAATDDGADSDESSAGDASGDETTSATGSASGGTFSPLDEGGHDGDAAPQPADGWWSPCLQPEHCDAGLACLTTDDQTDGVCTAQCVPWGNPQSCAPSPGGTAQAICLGVGGGSVCALDCANGRSCPTGMQCLADHDDLGPISICM